MSDIPPPSASCFIPDEIIPGILSYLPIKSLLRFRSVCKLWLNLISPEFVKSQPLRSISTSREKVVFSTKPLTSPIEHPIHNRIVNLDCPIIDPEHYVQVLGTCNGFVCLLVTKSLKKYFVIFSPSTGHFKHFPPVPDPMLMETGVGVRIYEDVFGGFAFDPSIDDYKVVLIGQRLADSSPNRVMVHHLRESSSDWRITGVYSDGFFADSSSFILIDKTPPNGVFLNGALHWVGGNHDPTFWRGPVGKIGVIVCFHLAEEVVSKMELPDEIFHPYGLGVLGGYLCVFRCGATSLEIWMMQEYGVKASWAKLYDLPDDVTPTLFDHWLVPVCFLRSGELLIVGNGQMTRRRKRGQVLIHTSATVLVAYNLGNGVLRSLVSDGHHDLRVAVLEAEGGVPPNGHLESVFLHSDSPESDQELSPGEVQRQWPSHSEQKRNPRGPMGTSTATPGHNNI